ncbi:unnamed protein product [Mycena citricolor]|uniref:Uncharacterized protein n=1 Tax=Mycena citricolor TaxID=2018698 RepID=A0AAD2HDJ1_9AGAR|nr:unnamed protein product [Mycena citricolor]
MPAGASLAAFIVTTLALVVPWYYFVLGKRPISTAPRLTLLTNIFVLLHSLYYIYQLIVCPPTNIFKSLRLPLATPVDVMRSILLRQSDTGELPAQLETLLKHLGSFDVKTFYVRFGHEVVSACDYCRTFDEFALFALPKILAVYIYAAATIGIVTIVGSGHERFRTLAVSAIGGAFCFEIYYIATVAVEFPKDERTSVVWWHDRLLLLRRLLFLALPPLISALPRVHTAIALSPTATALRTAELAFTRMKLLRLTRGAIMRAPLLRARADAWWAAQAQEGTWVREDAAVQDMARRLGTGFGDEDEDEDDGSGSESGGAGPLRAKAQESVASLAAGYAPSEFWRMAPS